MKTCEHWQHWLLQCTSTNQITFATWPMITVTQQNEARQVSAKQIQVSQQSSPVMERGQLKDGTKCVAGAD
jgi:hypothetical protein